MFSKVHWRSTSMSYWTELANDLAFAWKLDQTGNGAANGKRASTYGIMRLPTVWKHNPISLPWCQNGHHELPKIPQYLKYRKWYVGMTPMLNHSWVVACSQLRQNQCSPWWAQRSLGFPFGSAPQRASISVLEYRIPLCHSSGMQRGSPLWHSSAPIWWRG